jgi:FkbH-like protein
MLQNDQTAEISSGLNRQLWEIASETAGVHILNYETLTAFHGKGSIADQRLRHLARMEIGHEMFLKLARMMLAHMVALCGFGRKCVVLDLDNTLWGGIVGEDGPSELQLGPEYPGSAFVEFQQALLALYRRGVLLAINSKNNNADALAVLEHHPSMVLHPEHFAAMRINWKDKCENIEAIASELNLGLDAMVFVDDSPAERELMRRLRPEVLTPEWPTDPVLYASALEELLDFASISVTGEDLRRGEMYSAERGRSSLKERSATLQEYLFGLKMQVSIKEAEAVDIPRVTQLVQKTNQFNLTTRRYSFAQVENFLRADNTVVYVLRNTDAFGDNGLVGVAVVVKEVGGDSDPIWRIDSLLMSCRVLGRTIEDAFLHFLLNEANGKGAQYMVGEFIPTNKNIMVKDFYRDAGFRPAEVSERGSMWILDLASYTPLPFPWMSINAAADVDTQSRTMATAERHPSGIG